MTATGLDGVAVVTGGASGIGAACCRVLAARGARVAVLDRDGPRAREIADEVGGRAWVADVADESSLDAAATEIESGLGPVEILVNSAGIIQSPQRPTELPMDTYDRVVQVDQRGTYLASVVFARRMLPRRRGSIVNIASIAGMRALPLHAYAPAKAAVISMTGCLAAEWGPEGIRVNAVSPGYTRTPALQDAIDRGERDVSRLERNAALGRLVEPDEIARAVAFLVSPEASAITGANLPVDCGWLAASPWTTYGGLRTSGG
ncbi:MAG: SDR family oxidoreductase [Hyphomicrobiaceae bacterium]|nr:SDR family oxidoreductase [Hyphomicrobiaceae bacterium]